ncbi:putative inner membrane protein [Stieleria neptunia]|uniref:Putative inner membrane protein n=1 Tax=Stieleria neptunia TaxID=2527979 RepID=A0A518HV98_9BACT|nr:AI-2E family transporter [Stieleria neptunia]QDV44778.1 putative inner membrane protein [Stieleria neptunia]
MNSEPSENSDDAPRDRDETSSTESADAQPPSGPEPVGGAATDAHAAPPGDESTPRTALEKLPSLARITSVIMLIAGILVVGLLFYKVMVGFFIPLFMAAALVVIFRPVNEWILKKLNGRRRTAAVATTSVILAIVLMPIVLLLTVAIGQLTGLVSRTDLDDLKAAFERGRTRLGLELQHADRFRRLDDLAGMLDQIDEPDLVRAQIKESKELITFLDQEVVGAAPTGETGELAQVHLNELSQVVSQLETIQESEDTAERIAVEERFHRGSVVASASIHSWMNAKLGGSFRTEVKLLTNPSEKDLAAAIRAAREYLQPRFVKLSGVTGKVVAQIAIGMLIMVISIYFFFVDGPAMVHTLMRLSPLDDSYELRLLGEFEKTSRAVVLASILSALVQGLLAAIAFFFCGFESFILLFMVTTVMALIPFLGAASVWVPCAIYLAAVDQRYGAAIFLAIYGAAIVSSIDNVIKAYVLHGHSELHPLVALLSVLGGVPVFGPIGILIGPMVVVFLQTLLEILNHELELREAPEQDAVAPGG